MFPRKPDPRKAAKELTNNAVVFGTMVVTFRMLPYLLHLLQKASGK